MNLEQLQSERDDMEKEFEEIKRQLEEDTDKEIEDMKERWGSLAFARPAIGSLQLCLSLPC